MTDLLVPYEHRYRFATIGVFVVGIIAELHLHDVFGVALGFEFLPQCFKALLVEHLSYDLNLVEWFEFLFRRR